ncbi:substrate-binding domain-containing protein [Flagellimonas zhangzhouensis]|uniref:ABC-type nitrate/sulfonate/bicarbonate transport system, substrate-binding protein n=1 Tax=Flagellimonas zhangzhouensis TaxID=1073328 RepID=A0A1H2SFM7_9FLAO|nr:substrate-binding domain-containing protein [Allomuricauda zhangzhouensis]SDQ74194.1 ABC-type nitrate/sulfonate/bicarbonate transport system, substrate-binding protein [Allomuricauda zhangzhouensis]SDW30355.1 ABC-type nitrate/sulfonate/bicarbonate transport system, substrate-binding protein [Allomuricauda zhangzhouensis]
MKTVKIIGVPEHFNLPWHLAMEDNAFEDRGINLEWTDVPEGTGKMTQMLKDGEADMGIILTEGIIKSISQGNPSKIVQTYVSSPLLWGIHVDAHSDRDSIADLKEDKVAISRFGSGSHLMAYINAQNQGWNTESLEFEIINNLDGAVENLNSGSNAYFMWEHFTTKPLVDNGTFKRVGDCPTPWPCFVIAVSDAFLKENSGVVRHILEVINTYTAEFKQIPSIDRTLSNRYEQKLKDVKAWLSKTTWGQEQLSDKTVNEVQARLHDLNLVNDIKPVETFLWR